MCFKLNQKVVCIAGVKMKDKMFTVQNVVECTCGSIKLELFGLELPPEFEGTQCETCGNTFIGRRLPDSKYFRPVDETFAENLLAEIKEKAMADFAVMDEFLSPYVLTEK